MKHIDVVIISWAKDDALLQVTKDGLNSLFNSESDIAFHAYIVESNKDIRYEDLKEYQTESNHSIHTIHTDLPFGYHRYLNLGRREGSSPYVVLCNSDLTYEKDWATEIIKVMDEHPRFLSASPWCPQTQGKNTNYINDIFEGYQVRREIAGWCIFQQRKIYDIIGELDEQFEFWYCDNDYSVQLQLNKIKHCLVPASVVNHHDGDLGKTGNTLNEEEKRRITVEQSEVFTRKYQNLIKK
jgi:GT2 family glycosyltransferase